MLVVLCGPVCNVEGCQFSKLNIYYMAVGAASETGLSPVGSLRDMCEYV